MNHRDPHGYLTLARTARHVAATVGILALVFIAGLIVGHWL